MPRFAVARKSEHKRLRPTALTFLLWRLFAVAVLPVTTQAQMTEAEIIKLLAQDDLPAVRKKVEEIYRQRPSSAPAAYWRALMAEDGEEAAELFDEITLRFRNSEYADRAAYRLAQYHFARGNYHSAQKYFNDVMRRYPKSSLRCAARYFAAKSWLAAGALDSAIVELTACTQAFPETWVGALAREDLSQVSPEAFKKALAAPPQFTVQVGAYEKRDNATNQANKLRGMNYPAEVHERKQEKETRHLVWVGKFSTNEEAARYGEELRKKIGGKIQIVIHEP